MKTLKKITSVTVPADFDEVVEALNGADGMMARVVLFCDQDLCTVLEEMKFANRNIKGSYGGGEKLKRLYKDKGYEAVFEAVVKFCKNKRIKVMKTKVRYEYEEVK